MYYSIDYDYFHIHSFTYFYVANFTLQVKLSQYPTFIVSMHLFQFFLLVFHSAAPYVAMVSIIYLYYL